MEEKEFTIAYQAPYVFAIASAELKLWEKSIKRIVATINNLRNLLGLCPEMSGLKMILLSIKITS